MRAVDLIRKKRDGAELNSEEIAWLVNAHGPDGATDYQWSALLMAVVLRGMSRAETVALTQAMLHSGSIWDWSSFPGPKVDKHSTGGVGDKTSLILAPVAAAAGVLVPMISGRSLGHTGGTLDKLESIPGFRTRLSKEEFRDVLSRCGLALGGQTAEIAPADRWMYSLRDATATVESIPLITASILSKKLAEGVDGLVLDVKTGKGAFLTDVDASRTLAQTMIDIGRDMGKNMIALITRMDDPLGCAVGNACEIAESIACLKGEGPRDVTELSLELAAEMILMARHAADLDEARARARQTISDGSALECFRKVIIAQGGNPRVIDDPGWLPQPEAWVEIPAPRGGFVQAVDAMTVGRIATELGAGRDHAADAVDPAVGILIHKKPGEEVAQGEPLATILQGKRPVSPPHLDRLLDAFSIGDALGPHRSLIVERMS